MKFKNFFLKRNLSRYKTVNSDNDLEEWINSENPYECFTEEDKEKLKRIGTTLNSQVRKGINLDSDDAFNRVKRLIGCRQLKKPLVVFRGQRSIKYEKKLAKEHNICKKNYLYYDGFLYTSLYENNYYYHNNVRMKIYIPEGTNYLFTGQYSNTPDTQELILDIGTTLKILNKKRVKRNIYIEAIVEKNVNNRI